MLVYVLLYVAEYPQERINYAKAELILGAKDPRTIWKHILEGQLLSDLPGFGCLPEQKPGTGEYECLIATVNELNGAVRRMDGAVRTEVPVIGYVHSAYVYHRARNFLKTPLNRILINLPFFDTS